MLSNFWGYGKVCITNSLPPLEFEGLKHQAGANAFTMSPKKWIEGVNAIGIVSKSGRYGAMLLN